MILDFRKNWIFQKENGQRISVDLPHDAMIIEPRDGGCRNGVNSGYFPGGKYIYEKDFELDAAMIGNAILTPTTLRASALHPKASNGLHGAF